MQRGYGVVSMASGVGAAVLAAATLAGCVTNGDNFRSDTSWIKENVTKQADVRMVLGEPYSVGHAQGRPTWTYGYYRYRLFGKSHQKELRFYWNPDGTVGTFSINSSFPEDTGATGKAPSGKPSDKQPEF